MASLLAVILVKLTDAGLADAIAGDLEEERRRRARRSPWRARLWFWRASAAIVIQLAWHRAASSSIPQSSISQSSMRPSSMMPLPRSSLLLSEFRYAARALRRTPWYSSTVIGVIALAMALATTAFAVVDGVLFKPLPYGDAQRLFLIEVHRTTRQPGFTGFVKIRFTEDDLGDWMAAVPDLAVAGLEFAGRVPLGQGVNEQQFVVADVGARLFAVLGVRPLLGGFAPEHFAPPVPGVPRPVIISYDVWQGRLGGDPQVIGRRIVTDEVRGEAIEVVGVMPPGFVAPTSTDTQILRPAVPGSNEFGTVMARIPEGTNVDVIRQRIAASVHQQVARVERTPSGVVVRPPAPTRPGAPAAESAAPPEVIVRPLDVALRQNERPVALAAAVAAAALVLLACVSVSGLMLSRGHARSRELAVRRALGAGRRAIVRLVMTEIAVLVLCGAAAGLALAVFLLRVTLSLLPTDLRLLKPPAIDWRVAVFAAAAAAVCALVIAVWPIVRSLRSRALLTSSQDTHATPRLRSFGRVIVALEVAFGLAILLGGALVVSSLMRIWNNDLGFSTDHVLAIQLRLDRDPASAAPALEALVTRVRHLPGVVESGLTDGGVLAHRGQRVALEPPADASLDTVVLQHAVTPGFFSVTRPRLVAGRMPSAEEFLQAHQIVVSEGLARAYWPGQSALGQTIAGTRGGLFTVAGVVADARYLAWDFDPVAFAYLPYETFATTRTPTLLIRSVGDPGSIGADALREIDQAKPTVRPLRVNTLDAMLADTIRGSRFQSWIFGAFAVSAVTIAGVGILGLNAMNVGRRTRELGIRLSLGATRRRVVTLLLREQLLSVAVGLVAGGVVAAWATPALKAYLYETTVYDAWVWSLAVAVIVVTATVGAWIPARRASRIDPVTALRQN